MISCFNTLTLISMFQEIIIQEKRKNIHKILDKKYRKIIGLVRKPVLSFLGRKKQIMDIRNAILKSSKVNEIDILITGLGGIGKSELALHIAVMLKKEFQYNIIWVNSEQEDSIQKIFKKVVTDLSTAKDTKNKKFDDTEQLVNYFYNTICEKKGKKFLLIFDNAVNSTENFLTRYLPTVLVNREIVKIIVTSQYNDWPCNHLVSLNCFDEKEAVDFLKLKLEEINNDMFIKWNSSLDEKTPDDTKYEENTYRDLVVHLGCHTLALELAASYIINQKRNNFGKTEGFSIKDIINEIKQNKELLENEGKWREDISKRNANSVQTVFRSSINAVKSDEKYGELALKILKIMSVMKPDHIPQRFFNFFVIADDDDEEIVAESWLLLEQYSLIKYIDKRASIHRLVQEVILSENKNLLKEVLNDMEADLENKESYPKMKSFHDDDTDHMMQIWEHVNKQDLLVKNFCSILMGIKNFDSMEVSHEMDIFMSRLKTLLEPGSEKLLQLYRGSARRLSKRFVNFRLFPLYREVDNLPKMHFESKQMQGILYWKAFYLFLKKHFDDAKRIFIKLYEKYEDNKGLTENEFILIHTWLKIISCEQKQSSEERLWLDKLKLLIQKNLYTEVDGINLTNYNLVIEELWEFGFHVEVLSLCDLLSENLKKCNDMHSIVNILNFKARSLQELQQFDEAWSLWLGVYQRQVETFGIEHAKTRKTITDMIITATHLEETGKPEALSQYLGLWRTRIEGLQSLDVEIPYLEMIRKDLLILDSHDIVIPLCDLVILFVQPKLRNSELVLEILCFKGLNLHRLHKCEDAWKLWLDVYQRQVTASGINENNGDTILYMTRTAVKLNKPDIWELLFDRWKERMEYLKSLNDDTFEIRRIWSSVSELQESNLHNQVISLCDLLPKQLRESKMFHAILSLEAESYQYVQKFEDTWLLRHELYQRQVAEFGMDDNDTRKTIEEMSETVAKLNKPHGWDTYFGLWSTWIGHIKSEDYRSEGDVRLMSTIWTAVSNLHELNAHKQAIFLCDMAVRLLPLEFGEHEDVLRIIYIKAHSFQNLHNYKKAWLIWQDVYRRQVKALGEEQWQTRKTIKEMSEIVAKLDNPEAWETYFGLWKTWINHESEYPWKLTDDMTYVNNLNLFEAVLDHVTSTRGKYDPITLQVELWKAVCMWFNKKGDEAWEIYLKICELKNKLPEDRPKEEEKSNEKPWWRKSVFGSLVNNFSKKISDRRLPHLSRN